MKIKRKMLSTTEAVDLKAQAIEKAKNWSIERKIRFVLENSPLARYDAQRNMKVMPLPGSGLMLAANFTGAGVNAFATQVFDPERPGTDAYRAEGRGQVILEFHEGPWVERLTSEHAWAGWYIDNPATATIVERFAPMEGDQT